MKSKLPTCHISYLIRPYVTADSAPGIIVTDFNSPTIPITPAVSTAEPDVSSGAHYSNIKSSSIGVILNNNIHALSFINVYRTIYD